MFYNTQNLNNNIKQTQIEIQNNQNNNFNNNIPNNNINNSDNNISNSTMSNLDPAPAPIIKNLENSKNQNLYEKIKENQIKKNKEKLKEIFSGHIINEDGFPEKTSIGLDEAEYNFRKNLKKLASEYNNDSDNIYNILKETEDSFNNSKIKIEELINFIQSIEYEKEVFECDTITSRYSDLKEEIYNILEIKNNILELKNKTLNNISKYSKQTTKNFKKKLKKNTKEIIELCDSAILYLLKPPHEFSTSKENHIFRLIEANNKMVELQEKILKYIKSNILNLENNLKITDTTYSYSDDSENITSDEENENYIKNLLNKEIEEKLDKNETTKEETDEYEEKEEELTKEEEQKIIDRLIETNHYSEYTLQILKEDKKIKKRIDKDEKKLSKLRGSIWYQYCKKDDYFGKFNSKDSTGMIGADKEVKINIKHLIDIYTDDPNEVEKMLDVTTKSYNKLKNKSLKYIQFAKNLKYKEETLSFYEIKKRVDDKIKSIIKIKKQINELNNKISKKIKNSSSNNQKTKEFKKMFKNMTATLMAKIDEAAINLCKIIEKNRNTRDKNKYLDELLDTEYNTTIDLGRKIINYLELLFNDYKNLK